MVGTSLPLTFQALLVAFIASCGLVTTHPAEVVFRTLPEETSAERLGRVDVVDNRGTFRTGHPVDDVLEALGKSRDDATTVVRYTRDERAWIAGIVVAGVDPPVLLDAVEQHWQAPGVTSREATVIQGRDAVVMDRRDGSRIVAFERGGIVYVAYADYPPRAMSLAEAVQ